MLESNILIFSLVNDKKVKARAKKQEDDKKVKEAAKAKEPGKVPPPRRKAKKLLLHVNESHPTKPRISFVLSVGLSWLIPRCRTRA